MNKLRWIGLGGVVAVLGLAWLGMPAANAYTSPGKPAGYVNDYANVIPDDRQAALEANLKSFRGQKSTEIAVVTVKSLGGDAIETYANTLFREWGIGTKDKNNGVLLLAAIDDRRVRVEVGYGLEGALPDIIAGRIIREDITPKFKTGDYAGGIEAGVTKIQQAVKGEYKNTEPSQQKPSGGFDPFALLFFGFPLVLYIGSFMARSKSIKAGGILGGAAGGAGWLAAAAPWGLGLLIGGIAGGLLLDWMLSRNYKERAAQDLPVTWWGSGGGFFGGGGSGGFGGFGGGSSGGGGASGDW